MSPGDFYRACDISERLIVDEKVLSERYWCPIKAAHKPRFSHGWYKDFADYGNPEDWKEKSVAGETAFRDSYGEPCFLKK